MYPPECHIWSLKGCKTFQESIEMSFKRLYLYAACLIYDCKPVCKCTVSGRLQ